MILKNRKIVIFDWTNLCLRTAWASHVKKSETEIDYQMFDFSIWHSIYFALLKHKANSVILASDNGSWRPLIYPPYKQQRKLQKQKDLEEGKPTPITSEFFEHINEFAELIKQNLPFIYLSEFRCEADDIIAITTKNLCQENEIVIISSDCDYCQLLKYPNVKIWDPWPSKQCFVTLPEDPDDWVKIQALHGQDKDNIFNVFTRLDFPTEYNVMRESKEIPCIRKPSLTEKKAKEIIFSGKLEEFLNVTGPEEARKQNLKIEKENLKRKAEGLEPKQLYETDVASRYKFNFICISFDKIPEVLTKRVINQFEDYSFNENTDHYKFFKSMGWREPLENFEMTDNILNRCY